MKKLIIGGIILIIIMCLTGCVTVGHSDYRTAHYRTYPHHYYCGQCNRYHTGGHVQYHYHRRHWRR